MSHWKFIPGWTGAPVNRLTGELPSEGFVNTSKIVITPYFDNVDFSWARPRAVFVIRWFHPNSRPKPVTFRHFCSRFNCSVRETKWVFCDHSCWRYRINDIIPCGTAVHEREIVIDFFYLITHWITRLAWCSLRLCWRCILQGSNRVFRCREKPHRIGQPSMRVWCTAFHHGHNWFTGYNNWLNCNFSYITIVAYLFWL